MLNIFEKGLFEPLKVKILKNFIKSISEFMQFQFMRFKQYCNFILPSCFSKLFYNYHRKDGSLAKKTVGMFGAF